MKLDDYKQACVSELSEGKYNYIIKDLLCCNECGADIMYIIMTLSRGHENPMMVYEKIDEIRKEL